MRTATADQLITLSGAIQVPLLRAEQLLVGSIITGRAWQRVAEVVELERGGIAITRKLPHPLMPPHHIHAFTLFGNVQCECGLARDVIRTAFLPRAGDSPRTWILQPVGPLQDVDAFTIYCATSSRTMMQVDANGKWLHELVPVVPLLRPVWSLPPALVEWLRR